MPEDNMEEIAPCDYVALKGVFYTPKSGETGGAFCLAYLGESGKILSKFFHAVRMEGVPKINLSSKWEDFISEFGNIGPYDKVLSDKAAEIIPNATDKLRPFLFNNINDAGPIEAEIRKALEKSLHYMVEVNVCAELFDKNRAEEGGIIRRENLPTSSDDGASGGALEGVEFGKMLLACQPEIDPINGFPVSSLNVGDRIYAKISETNDIAKKVVDIMRAEGSEPIFHIKHLQQLETGQISIILQINDEIQAIMKATGELKVKTDGKVRGSSQISASEHGAFVIQLAALGGVLLFIALLVYFIRQLL